MAELKNFLKIPIPDELYSRELLRVLSNDVHGELVLTVSGKGELIIGVYEQKRATNGDLQFKSYRINHNGMVVSEKKLERFYGWKKCNKCGRVIVRDRTLNHCYIIYITGCNHSCAHDFKPYRRLSYHEETI